MKKSKGLFADIANASSPEITPGSIRESFEILKSKPIPPNGKFIGFTKKVVWGREVWLSLNEDMLVTGYFHKNTAKKIMDYLDKSQIPYSIFNEDGGLTHLQANPPEKTEEK